MAFLVGQLGARPVDGFGGVGIETFQMVVGGAVFVVVALDAGDVHVADDLEAFLGIGVVADDVAEADVMRGLLLFGVRQNGVERFQIAVNVSDDGEFHLRLSNNFKSMKFILRVAPRDLSSRIKSRKPRVANGGAKGFQFRARAFGDQFHAAVRQIAHGAGHFKSGGDGFRGVAKTDALHVAGVKNAMRQRFMLDR